ncbi:Meckel syndrome type 1 protein-like [Trichogramma pretiosum]|uniref:Meckel syndrome type 1 protein-like n=1 Tax=Trichogramma pretiosum TaxID=7493 RepID=UPI000C71B4A2|nr:Meckel syndrome type 1 protein-like [Trichogramma pretiosum]
MLSEALLQGKAKISGKYRVDQPIENLKIRVRIVQQKSLLSELFENAEETRDANFLEEEVHTFAWQEKRFGPYEARFYRDERNCLNERQKGYHRRLTSERNDEEEVCSRLYSYVEGDAYYVESAPLSDNDFRSPLASRNERALPRLSNRKPFGERHNKQVIDPAPQHQRIRQNHYFYAERQSMYIVADLSPRDEEEAASKSSSSSRGNSDSETLLCALSYDPGRKCLTVSPDFSSLECYSCQATGMSYDYWIEHVSSKPTTRDIQRRSDTLKKENQRKLKQHQSEIYRVLESPAEARVLRMHVNLDIGSAQDFQQAKDTGLFVSYFIDLPSDSWYSKSKLAGRTQRSRVSRSTDVQGRRVNFSHTCEIVLDLNYLSDWQLCPWPRLLISVASLDAWTRYRIEGYASMVLPRSAGHFSFRLPAWRPQAGFIDSLRRFFTGGTCELDDITYCAVPSMQLNSTCLDKSNLKVVPSGSVDLTVNIVQQCRQFVSHRPDQNKIKAGRLLNKVDDVLTQFKEARERMIQARAMCS